MQKSPDTLSIENHGQVAEQASQLQFADFWDMPHEQRRTTLLTATSQVHAWHYQRNQAYRHTVAARGVGPQITNDDIPLILRPTAQTFKSYIDILGTPFAQDQPRATLEWLADQLSIDLPRTRFDQFRTSYSSLEKLLIDIERIYADYGLEISTSSGTSGRSTIMVRDQESINLTVESFRQSFIRYLGTLANHRGIFIMPQETRIAMVRMATFSFTRAGLQKERLHFTIPFPAHPDQVRIRAGRTFQPGLSGWMEQRIMHPFMNWANERVVMPRAIQQALELIKAVESTQEKVLFFGGWIQLHQVCLQLAQEGRIIRLAPGSLIGSGGGFKEQYPCKPAQIRKDLARVFQLSDNQAVPIRDVYGMAESNWAAMQCHQGNYHVPPWVLAVTLDADDRFQLEPDTSGRLAFFDPIGGGKLFPAFFKTADRMRLINGLGGYEPGLNCACGDIGTYITQDSIQRVDLLDEAGCAAQV